MKRIRREFYFTKKERKSLLFLSILILTLLIGLIILYKFDTPKVYDFKDLGIEKLEDEKNTLLPKKKAYEYKNSKKQRFKFDPNTISEDSLKALGIVEQAINNLIKYRSKGGKIKNIEHFYKIYGMERYKGELDSFLLFKESLGEKENLNLKKTQSDKTQKTFGQIVEKKAISVVSLRRIDINRSDSFELQSLKGIGSIIAKRIIKYRDALGGYYDVSQLEEVYGMNSQTFMDVNHLIEIDLTAIKKININDVDEKMLEKHPYISKKQASIIIKYRNNHGNYKSYEDFSKVKIFSTEELNKLNNYLSY